MRLAIGVLLLIPACGGGLGEISPELRRKAANTPILTAEQIAGRPYTVLKPVRGLSCARQMGASPSMEAASEDLRVLAAQANADAVANVLCHEPGSIDWGNNCWKTAVCEGDAIRWNAAQAADTQERSP
jgi:RcsF-like lipoprotein